VIAAAKNPEQYTLDLTHPAGHADMLGQYRAGLARVVWLKDRAPAWRSLPHDELRALLAQHLAEPDVYLTPNTFHGWRRTQLLAGLHALYIDVDQHDGGDVDLMGLAALALSRIDAAGIPEPNALIYTGRGIHVYWLIEPLPAKALPRWQACQRQLCAILGGDRQAVDCTRVLRVVGTVNSKTGRTVTAEAIHGERYDFDFLFDQIMPATRAEVRQRVQVRDIRAAQGKAGTKRRTATGSIYERWYLVYRDLWRIVEANEWRSSGVPKGQRDRLLFHMANALSWFTVSDSLEAEIIDVARKLMPTLTEAEALSYTSSVVARARADAKKDDGRRYKYKRVTLWNALSDLIEPHPELVHELRAIIPDDLHEQRERERLRQRDGVKVDRATYLATAAERKEKTALLRAQGMTQREIATELGLSVGAVNGYLKDVQSPPLV